MTKTLFKKEFLGNPKARGRENKPRKQKPLASTAAANIEFSPASSQVNIKPHIKSLIALVSS